jgi:hypothetical protein
MATFCLVLSAWAQPAEPTPAAIVLRAMRISLTRATAVPRNLSAAEDAEFGRLITETHGALTALRGSVGKCDVPEDYLADLTAGGLALRRIAAKTALDSADLARLQRVLRDLVAKRDFAAGHPSSPAGPSPIQIEITGERLAAHDAAVWFEHALDDEHAAHAAARFTADTLRPGYFVFWCRTGGARPIDGPRAEVAIDGTIHRAGVLAP